MNPVYIVSGVALIVLGAMFVAPFIKLAFCKFRNIGIAFTIIAFGFLHSAATKPSGPSITWDDGIANNGSTWNSSTNGVNFAWTKTDATLPNTQPLYISKKAKLGGTEWVLAATTTVGAFSYSLLQSEPQAYDYYVWHEYIPPTPVHTNGVWLGTVVEKAKNSGVDKILVIQGQLIENGRKLNQ